MVIKMGEKVLKNKLGGYETDKTPKEDNFT
jgi:hypothetical protein